MVIAFLSNGNVHIEAYRLVLLRAKTCELLCRNSAELSEYSSTAFLVGLMSGVDILLKITVRDFVAQLNLSEIVKFAVLEGEGSLGPLLEMVRKLEFTLAQSPNGIAKMPEPILQAYKEADDWVVGVVDALKGR